MNTPLSYDKAKRKLPTFSNLPESSFIKEKRKECISLQSCEGKNAIKSISNASFKKPFEPMKICGSSDNVKIEKELPMFSHFEQQGLLPSINEMRTNLSQSSTTTSSNMEKDGRNKKTKVALGNLSSDFAAFLRTLMVIAGINVAETMTDHR